MGNLPSETDGLTKTSATFPIRDPLLLGQKRILELVATGAPLAAILDELILFIEAQESGLRCGLLMVSDDGLHLCPGRGPSLPAYLQALHQAIDGVPITPPYHGVWGQVVDQGNPVLVPDIATETRYSPAWRDLLLSFGLMACRSTPVRGSDGRVLATFAMYYDHPRDPTPAEPHLIDIATHLAAIAIERDQEQARMHQSQDRLETELADMQRLQEISATLIQEGDIDALYRRILGAAAVLMRSDFASMQKFDTDRCELRLLAYKGFSPSAAAGWERVGPGSNISCAVAMRTVERTIVSNVETCDFMVGTADLAIYRDLGIRSMQSTPLTSRGGGLIGMISTHWRKPHEPTERDLRLLDVLARQAADLIERSQSAALLREREARLSAMFDNAGVGMVLMSGDCSIIHANAGYCAITGRTKEELIGSCCIDFTHPDDIAAHREVVASFGHSGEPVAFEERYLGKDGRITWVRITLSMADAGQVVAVVEDITTRREAEECQRLLTNELNHRVKNTLAVIQSMAAQTARFTPDPTAFNVAFSSRVIALARVHDILAKTAWAGAMLDDVVATSLAPFRDGNTTAINASGPPVRLGANVAVVLSLGLHELATNAVKYGALKNARGRIDLTWTVGGAPPQVHIAWAERNGPTVVPPTREGFGSRLIQNLGEQLDGEISLDYCPHGLRCNLVLPLPTMN
jgi:PAS domain S-box-containing protein